MATATALVAALLAGAPKAWAQAEAKTEDKAKPEAKPDAKPEANPEAKPAETRPSPGLQEQAPSPADVAAARQLLATLAATGAAEARGAAARKLAELAPRIVPLLDAELARTRATSVALRRAVLVAIDAAVPDASGKFSQPKRQQSSELRANDEVDWLPALLALDLAKVELPRDKRRKTDDDDGDDGSGDARDGASVPAEGADGADGIAAALSEVIVDVAMLRALAAARDPRAAAPLFDAAFDAATMIYRDECGRYLRKMEARAIPVLTLESQGDGDRRRYATYQLERLDRQEPSKALTAATADESLLIAILDAFRTTRHREAVYAVFSYIDQDSPRVRAAARAAWLAYVTGKAPPPAPKRKMVMPGGKLAEKATPMWLTYRELAEEKLRKASAELLGEELPDNEDVDVEALSRRVFAHLDGIRAKREAEQWSQAKALATAGDLAGAAARMDQLLAINPDRSERAQMAELYLSHARALQKQDKWDEAAAAFSKAYGLDPRGGGSKEAEAGRDFALGKAMEADGKDGTGLFRRAAVTRPDFEEAAEAAADGARPRWMLYAATLAGLAAIALAALGVARRRRAA